MYALPATPEMPNPVNVATPELGVADVVPTRAPPTPLVMLAVIGNTALETRFPSTS